MSPRLTRPVMRLRTTVGTSVRLNDMDCWLFHISVVRSGDKKMQKMQKMQRMGKMEKSQNGARERTWVGG
jgi:hypothetical protein